MATEGRIGTGQSVGTDEELIFDAVGGVARKTATLMVRCLGPGNDCRIRVVGLHSDDPDTGVRILAGEREYFRLGTNGIRQVYAQGIGGNATIDWAPVAAT
jgi:hypothetical protein